MAAVSEPAHDPMLPQPGRVRGRRRDGSDVWTLEIEPECAVPFAPGQFNMLTAFGIGEVAISMSGDPASPGRLVHSIRPVGLVSGALAGLPRGAPIGVRGPFGVGWPMAELAGRDVVVIAGGLGLAPLRPAIYRLLGERDRYGQVALLCGARSPGDILFPQELERWRNRGDCEVQVTVDHADADWKGDVGVVTMLVPRVTLDPSRVIGLVCGPEIMMRFAITALREAGLPDEAIYLSMERNMKCAIGFCGHCQFGPSFVCRDGPVYRYDRVRDLLALKEL